MNGCLQVLREVDLREGRRDRGDLGIAGVGVDRAAELCVGVEIRRTRGWMDDGQVRGGGLRVVVRPLNLAARGAGRVGFLEVGLRQLAHAE